MDVGRSLVRVVALATVAVTLVAVPAAAAGGDWAPSPRMHAAPPSTVPTVGALVIRHDPDVDELTGIACPTVATCFATGYSDGTVVGGTVVPIIADVPGDAIVTGSTGTELFGIACVSATECVVGGQSQPGTGGAWLLDNDVLTPITLGASGADHNSVSTFEGVACPTSTKCELVGDGSNTGGEIAEVGVVTLSGATATEVTNEETEGVTPLTSISCPSASVCFAGGGGSGNGQVVMLPATGSPVVTHAVDAPGPDGIACLTTSSCAVAATGSLDGEPQGYIGAYTSPDTLNPIEDDNFAAALAMSTLGSNEYVAVGGDAIPYQAVDIDTAAGVAISGKSLAYPGNLQGVTCLSASMCVAVGYSSDGVSTSFPGTKEGTDRDGAVVTFAIKRPSPPRPKPKRPHAPKVRVSKVTTSSETVRVTAPANNGGKPIISYHLVVEHCVVKHHKCRLHILKTAKLRPGRPVTIKRLRAVTTYFFKARATNVVGTGPYSRLVHHKTKAVPKKKK